MFSLNNNILVLSLIFNQFMYCNNALYENNNKKANCLKYLISNDLLSFKKTVGFFYYNVLLLFNNVIIRQKTQETKRLKDRSRGSLKDFGLKVPK